MNRGKIFLPDPEERLGLMVALSLACHLALFAGVLFLFPASGSKPGLTPSYTVDLVSLPSPPPAGPDSPSAPAPAPTPAPEAKKVQEAVPPAPVPAPKAPLAKEAPVAEAPNPAAPAPEKLLPERAASSPTPATLKPRLPVPIKKPPPAKPEVAKSPPPAKLKPQARATQGKKPVLAQPKTAKLTKPKPLSPGSARVAQPRGQPKAQPPVARPSPRTSDQTRERAITRAIQATKQQAAKARREQAITAATRDAEEALAAQARDQAYQKAVAAVAAKLNAGKVSAQGAGQSASTGTAPGASRPGSSHDPESGITRDYMQRVAQIIRSYWQPHCVPRRDLKELKAVIIVQVLADGTIAASWFEKESGDRLYDQSAMAAITRANPLPALPPGQEQLEIGITFTPEGKATS